MPIDGYASMLTESLGQISCQQLVLLIHRKIALAYTGQAFNNRLTTKYPRSSSYKFSSLEGKPKCKHFDSPSGANEEVIIEKQTKNSCVLTWRLDSGGPLEEVTRMKYFSAWVFFGSLGVLRRSQLSTTSASLSYD
jgi:hypothetical protein